MPRCRPVWLLVVGIALTLSVISLGSTGEPQTTVLKQYWGKIASVRIDRCGKRPGLCEGMIILTPYDGGSLALAIRPGTWIRCGDRLVLLEELHVGNDIHVQAIEINEEGVMRATTIEAPAQP